MDKNKHTKFARGKVGARKIEVFNKRTKCYEDAWMATVAGEFLRLKGSRRHHPTRDKALESAILVREAIRLSLAKRRINKRMSGKRSVVRPDALVDLPLHAQIERLFPLNSQ